MTRRRWLRAGIGTIALVAVVVATTVSLVRTGEEKAVVTAIFADASPLVSGNLVKMDGVQVGLIESIELRDRRAVVRMELDRTALPLHEDASVEIRALSLLGERYVELNRGSDSAPVADLPTTIPEERTKRAVELQDILDTLDDPTSTALAALVTTLGEGTAGQGKSIDATLKALAPAMTDGARLGDVLDEQNAVLASLIDKLKPVTEALADGHGRELDQLVGSTTATLTDVASERVALDAALRRLPGTLQKAQQTLAEVTGAGTAAAETLHHIRPVTANLSDITAELRHFVDNADPALASLPPVLRHAESLIAQATPLVRDLRPGAATLPEIGSSADRLVGELTPNLTVVLDFMKYWALSTNGEDGLGNYFRGVVADTPQSLLQIPGLSLPGAQPQDPPSARQGPARERQAGPALPLPAEAPSREHAAPTGDQGDSVTGLSRQQEQSLLGQLLGGVR